MCTTQTAVLPAVHILSEPRIYSVALSLVRALAYSTNEAEAIQTVVHHATRFPGISAVEFEAAGTSACADVTAFRFPVTANGSYWGTLTVRYNPSGRRTQLIAEFLAQELGMSLNRLKAEAVNRQLRESLQGWEHDLHTRKVLHRARGVVARWYGVSEQVAEVRIRTLGDQSGRTVAEVAAAVIEAEELPVAVATACLSAYE